MEKYAFELKRELGQRCAVRAIVRTKPRGLALAAFGLGLLPRAIFECGKDKPDVVMLADSSLAPFGWLISRVFRVKTVSLAHGLDIIYDKFWYRKLVLPFVRRMDVVVANSRVTEQECRKRGIKRVEVINCGSDAKGFSEQLKKGVLPVGDICDRLQDKKIILSVGHLVERKGFFWFARDVVPNLPKEYVYAIVGGKGNDTAGMDRVREIEEDPALRGRVIFLGKLSDEALYSLYQAQETKALIMPNIAKPGDVEGFGIVALEAALAGLPVVASDMEGMRDSVIQDKTGLRVPSQDAQAFAQAIKQVEEKEWKGMGSVVEERFGWERIGKEWETLLKSI
jgi:glycosyltransferase involved in cell wall biosynthesis